MDFILLFLLLEFLQKKKLRQREEKIKKEKGRNKKN